MSADATGDALQNALTRSGLACIQAKHGSPFQNGRIYLAPPDHHLMIVRGKTLVTRALAKPLPPAVDPLFRSAAVAYRSRVIGLVLTGFLDDGTAGMMAIKRCGGVCVVQDPEDAAFPDMPRNVMKQVKVDHVVPLSGMGALLVKLLTKRVRKNKPVPNDIAIEARIAERILSDLPAVEAVGERYRSIVPAAAEFFGRWQREAASLSLPHRDSYTSSALLAEQSAKIEETLDRATHVRGAQEPADDHERK